jgi:hypothetical protein
MDVQGLLQLADTHLALGELAQQEQPVLVSENFEGGNCLASGAAQEFRIDDE